MVMAGGTGGHVFPALAVAQWLQQQGCGVFWLGTPGGMESRLIPHYGIEIEQVEIKGVRGTGLKRRLAAPFVLLRALWQVSVILRRKRPALVLGMGGFVSGPGGLMAWVMRIPLVIQEQNAVPGLTNRLLAPLARRVFEAFPGSFDAARRALNSGNPVRAEITALAAPAERFAARSGPLRLLVLGGSLGAQALNETVPKALALLEPAQRPQVRHQAGERNFVVAQQAYRDLGISAEVKPFEEDMAAAYGWADLVICRAGALTISELAAAGLGAILVPYPHAVDDHQTRNAAFLVNAGAAQLLPQSELDAADLADRLSRLSADRGELMKMAGAARALAQPDAAERVGRACLEVMNHE
ncbi:UDP-N-acetylglucosamine--N-acetylmuramyl-(pentapeptide) pyrophosphoryl-undecaprenol N-acetylglucosamine transferase [endosymbiont of Tevnia jerichonana (vent Tica)]|jgi:UDP-N-acetylglucosamine--N-acetylmuramyl-(pentapeptide) pyrophosphoryl-undecaprenol N-acetylglucosamine transferase|uniref:UDP-N-acetylglucosamine--N-acetylmuramyl-(pentapeptide) pyrophosphoryl-undecaprenol N-acetylglucosamine transferase n=3 Tax=Gammaproteobacteria TaxID=1236 RepID=G2FET3_9GAMM|nr:UDP-N-acetylglucosamine--N-acetylmuramyl-(pentapeptide) pyrophosphoryl-undecaprenol N-acetylglucosamine transferase [endosymbiont of Tevnia jerichonana (vent Tica)]